MMGKYLTYNDNTDNSDNYNVTKYCRYTII